MRNILITGGAGFIGSNFIPYFIKENSEVSIINIDKLTYAGNLDNLTELTNNPRYTFVKGDITDKQFISLIFKEYNIKGVIHFAAESHVDNSIANPEIFLKTNILGTFNLLETARDYWMTQPNIYKKDYKDCRFHHISTDEVYGSLREIGLFTEMSSYAPNSPYSASKASSDFMVRSYFHTYGMNVVTTNCSNNYGPKQHGEKLIPSIIRNALNDKPIPIYGKGINIRDWLYVLDHCKGINLAYKNGIPGETYNIGGNNEQTNLDIAHKICEILDIKIPRKQGKYEELITFVKDRLGHDFRYAIDATKIATKLGWQADEDFESGIIKTIDWYLENKIFNINNKQ